MTFDLLPEGVEETSCAKIRGKDSPGRRNKSKGPKGRLLDRFEDKEEDQGFWGIVSPRESREVSGLHGSLGEDYSSLVGHSKEFRFYF